MQPTVAVLGTGIMGEPMARNIARAGLAVRVWNRTTEKAAPLEQDGCALADTPAEAAAGADVVVTMLADTEAVLETMEGEAGALAGMSDDAVWAQMSTVGISGTERLGALAAERGVAFVDAPVLGTRQPAEDAKLVVLASGPEAAVDRCAPVFDAVAERVMRLGEAGEATRLKVVINDWILGIVENVGETIAFAQAIGVDPRRFLEAIDGGAVGSPYAQIKGRALLDGNLEPSFTLRLARKDIGLVLEAAERHGIDLPLAATVARQFDRAIELGHGEEDMAATYFATTMSET